MDIFEAMEVYADRPTLLRSMLENSYTKFGKSCESCAFLRKNPDQSKSDYYCDKLKRGCGCIQFVSCGRYEMRRV